MLVFTLLQRFLSHHARPVPELRQFLVPIHSMQQELSPCLLKLQNIWFQNLWRLLKTSVYIKSSVSAAVPNAAVSDSTNIC